MKQTLPTLLRLAFFTCVATTLAASQQQTETPPPFSGQHAELTAPQQRLVEDWVQRFRKLTGQKIATDAFYDDFVRLLRRRPTRR